MFSLSRVSFIYTVNLHPRKTSHQYTVYLTFLPAEMFLEYIEVTSFMKASVLLNMFFLLKELPMNLYLLSKYVKISDKLPIS